VSEPIKVGDLVVVVRIACGCGYSKALGRIFTVKEINDKHTTCNGCGVKAVGPFATSGWMGRNHLGKLTLAAYAVRRLRRIPPLGELEGVDEKETLHA
jgi:hypothetical protein